MLASVCLASLCLASTAAAQGEGLVVIPRPATQSGLSYLTVETRPGREQSAGAIELVNRGSRPLRARIVPVEGITLSTLGSAYGPPGSPRHGSSGWLRVGSHRLVLAPGASALVKIGVAVPAHARPGDYLSGISVEAAGQSAGRASGGGSGASAVSSVRYAIGVETSVPGRRVPSIRFTGARLQRDPSSLTFLLLASNNGNVILQRVHGHVRISRGGHTVLSRELPGGTFVAHTSIAYPVPALGEHPSEGTRYEVSAWLRYGGGVARLNTTVTFGHRAAANQSLYSKPHHDGTHVPWWAATLLGTAVLYGAATTAALWKRRSKQAPLEAPGRWPHDSAPQAEDQLDRTPAGRH